MSGRRRCTSQCSCPRVRAPRSWQRFRTGFVGAARAAPLFVRRGGVVRSRADKNGAYRRRPPLAATLRGRDLFSIELARDLAQALASGVSSSEVSDQLGRESRLATGTSGLPTSRRLPTLDEVTLELGDWDQPCTPFRLHCFDCRDDAAIERCEADADRFGGLLARVGESLDPLGELDIRRRQLPWWRRVAMLFLAPSPLPPVRHPLHRTTTLRLISTQVHLCDAGYPFWSCCPLRPSYSSSPMLRSISAMRWSMRRAGSSCSRPRAAVMRARSPMDAIATRTPEPRCSRVAARRRSS